MGRPLVKIVLEVNPKDWDELLDSPENQNLGIPEVLEQIKESFNDSFPVISIDKINLVEEPECIYTRPKVCENSECRVLNKCRLNRE